MWTNIVVASGQTRKGLGTGQVRERKPKWKLIERGREKGGEATLLTTELS